MDPATDAAGTTRPEVQADYTPQGQVSVLRETSAIAGQWRTTRAAYNTHGEQAAGFGPRSVGAEEARTQMDRNAFGEVITTRRRLEGKWLTFTTGYDTAGNKKQVTQPTGNGASLESLYRYDALGRLAEQTKDPSNPGHTVDFTYENEGAQLTRVDKVAGTVERITASAYNPEGTLQSQVAKDRGGATLATCNWAAGQSNTSGYDADHNLLASRTVGGTTGCGAGGTTTRALTMGYDPRGAMATMTQSVRSPETGQNVVRTQSFAHRNDGALIAATHDGRTTTYANSPAGWTESLTDWRAKPSTHTYAPAGNVVSDNLGDGAATSTRTYHPDGMPQSLTWRGRGGASVRAHTAIDYDIGGLRKSENVSVIQPPEAVGADTGGVASYDYDLADRLTRYTSPYKDAPTDVAKPTTTYTLDDGANVTQQTTTVGSEARAEETSSYPDGRLATRRTVTNGAAPTAEDTTYGYSPLGEESDRTTTGGVSSARGSAYDPAGHTATVDDRSAPTAADVDYAYDGSDNLISRKESAGGAAAKAKLYFYWGMGTILAEETDGRGATLARYLVDGSDTLAQETYRVGVDGHRDPTDTAGTWTWLLDDPSGNVATHVGDDGAVSKQVAFDPYGRPEKGGTGKSATAPGSSLGFQGAHTDPTTGSVILGPRQYDPTTTRFTSPDVYGSGDLDLGLGTDELTGNRYLFAAANPVAYYEDGHGPCPPFLHRKRKEDGSHYCKGTLARPPAPKMEPADGFGGGDFAAKPSATPPPASQDVSQKGLDFIARFEGFRPELHEDPAGNCSKGIGHLVHRGRCTNQDRAQNPPLSYGEAIGLLRADAAGAVDAVRLLVKVQLDQAQFDALVDFTFNLGSGTLANSQLLARLNSGDYGAVPGQLNRFVNASGTRFPGLVIRRRAEGRLFSAGQYE